jgi:predicted transcriptional regulator
MQTGTHKPGSRRRRSDWIGPRRTVSARLPLDVFERIQAAAEAEGKSPTRVTLEALLEWESRRTAKGGAGAAELAASSQET